MSSWRKGLAAAAVGLALAGVGQAQQVPTPVGAARMPEPLRCPPSEPLPALVPGPITPQMAPPGPPEELSLSAWHSGAFQCENYTMETAFYASAGTFALKRQRFGKGVAIAGLDSGDIDTGTVTAPGTGVVLQRFGDIPTDYNWGVRGSIGYLWGNQAIELSGFGIFDRTKSNEVAFPGRVDAFFNNAPLGFEGNNGLWLQADRLNTSLSTTLANAEVNYRLWNSGIHQVELLMGVRFLHLREQLGIFTDDEGLTFRDINGQPDLTRQATYGVQTRNYIIAPQIGFEYSTPLPHMFNCIWIGAMGKAAWGPNLINTNVTLTRGDEFSGFNTRRNSVSFGQIYEAGAFVDLHLLERLRLRGGYNVLFVVGVATAGDQVDFNLANTFGKQDDHNSVLFHGPQIELQFLF